jgi:hypothetical protein
VEEQPGQESLRAARFLEQAEAKMPWLSISPKGASFRAKLAKEACCLVNNRRFSGVFVYW